MYVVTTGIDRVHDRGMDVRHVCMKHACVHADVHVAASTCEVPAVPRWLPRPHSWSCHA